VHASRARDEPVSNNPYALDRPLIGGTRPAMDSGQLGIVVLDAPGNSPHSPGRAWTAPRLEVNAPAPVHAGVDAAPWHRSASVAPCSGSRETRSGDERGTRADRRIRPTGGRAAAGRRLVPVGAIRQRAAVGHGPGGLQR